MSYNGPPPPGLHKPRPSPPPPPPKNDWRPEAENQKPEPQDSGSWLGWLLAGMFLGCFLVGTALPRSAVAEEETVITFRVTGDVRMFVDGRPVKRIDITTEQLGAASGGASAGVSAGGEALADEGAAARMGAGPHLTWSGVALSVFFGGYYLLKRGKAWA